MNEETEKVSSDFLITQELPEIPHYDGSKFDKWRENSEAIINFFKEYDYEDNIKNDRWTITKTSVENAIPQFIKEKGNKCEMIKKERNTNLKWKDISSYLPEVLYIEATKKISEEVKTSERSKSIYKKILEKIILKSIEDNLDDSKIIEAFKKNRNQLEPLLKKGEDEEDKRFEIIKQIESNLLKNLNQNITTKSIEIKIFPPRLQDFFSNTDIIINDGIESSIENKGDGLKRSLIFSLFITYSEYLKNKIKDKGISEDKPFLFLIEEPELYLHPQAQKSLRDILILISKYDPVFYSTHSSNFVDISKYLSIGLTNKEPIETGTQISFI
jgi:predicted ATP-dependent endonuclease of OLD family